MSHLLQWRKKKASCILTLLIITYLSRASHKVTPERNSKAEQNLQGRAEDENYFVFTAGIILEESQIEYKYPLESISKEMQFQNRGSRWL